MFNSAKGVEMEKKTWTAPAIEEFKVEDITKSGGPDTIDGCGTSIAATS